MLLNRSLTDNRAHAWIWATPVFAAAIVPAVTFGQDAPAPAPTAADAIKKADDLQVVANTVRVLIAGMLVFWMNAGFACLETGLCRRKNAVNILAKNFIVFAVASIAFWVIGFGMMFGKSVIGGEEGAKGFLGWASMFPSLLDPTTTDYPG